MKYIITNKSTVECKICGKQLKKIDGRHLRIHDISIEEYIEKYNSPTITKNKYDRELQNIEKRKLSKLNLENKLKNVKCFFCQCEFEVNINVSNFYSVCNQCKEKGLISPIIEKTRKASIEGMIKKYGIDNPSKLKTVIKKRSQTFKEKSESEKQNIIDKRNKSLIKKFGNNPQIEIQKLREEGMLKKHGVRFALQSIQGHNNLLETLKTKNDFHNMVKKVKTTKLQKYGDENYINKEKILQTNLLKYGGRSPTCSKEVIEKSKITTIERMTEKLKNKLTEYNLKLLDEGYVNAHYKYDFQCLTCDHCFEQNWNAIQQGFTCPNCRSISKGPSQGQLELQLFVEECGFKNISYDNRVIINPLELDIVIHDINVAIEYCGLYWHNHSKLSESRLNFPENIKRFHLHKKLEAAKKGYNLIHIFEDEWLFKKDIVLSRLKQIFGLNKTNVIHGRKCKIQIIDSSIKNDFLNRFHIQGKGNALINLGAYYNDELVSVMTFSKPNISKGGKKTEKNIFELNRFCIDSKYHIPGIAGKLLAYFKNNFDWDELFSFCDLRWSNGNLYRKLGFVTNEKPVLNYWYWHPNKKMKRIHRFNLRKRPDEPKNITEEVLRKEEGYLVIWDCGNLKFTMTR